MSSGKCPCCGSKDVSGVCCNICGTPLMFFDNENKRPVTAIEARTIKETNSKEVSDRIKDMDGVNATPSISKDDIVREILEKSKVSTSSASEEYVQPADDVNQESVESNEGEDFASDESSVEDIPENEAVEDRSDTKEFSFDFSDANKSFVELGRELKLFKKNQEKELSESLDNVDANHEQLIDVDDEVSSDVIEDISERNAVSEITEETNEEATGEISGQQTEAKSEEVSDSESEDVIAQELTEENSQVCEERNVSQDTIIVSLETTDITDSENIPENDVSEEPSADDVQASCEDEVHNDEKTQMVDKISQAVSSQIESEEDDTPGNPQWKDIDKMQVSEEKNDNEYFYETKPTLLLNVCKWILASLMLIMTVCMFMPYTKIGGLSDEHDVQLFAIISVIPYVVGLFLSVLERGYIRKYIYSLFVNLAFLGLYMMFFFKYPIESVKDIVYPLLCSLMMLVSIVGVIADRSPMLKKANSWFDSFVYIYMFTNLFIIFFVTAVMFLVPDMINADIRSYLYKLLVILLLGVISAVLILKRLLVGADLMLLTSIVFIVTNIMTYNRIMDANSFNFTVDLPYMHYVGFITSCITAVCTVFPIVMFFWMRFLKKRTPVRKKIKKTKKEVVQ